MEKLSIILLLLVALSGFGQTITTKQGDSFTALLVMDSTYTLTNLKDLSVYVNNTEVARKSLGTITATNVARAFKMSLSSATMRRFQGNNNLQIAVYDSLLGVKRTPVITLVVTASSNSFNNSSTNVGIDATININVISLGITTDVILATVMKGDPGIDSTLYLQKSTATVLYQPKGSYVPKSDTSLYVRKVTGYQLSQNSYTTTEKTKLAGVAAGATANSTDAQLRDRSTHTGTQSNTTITGLGTASTLNVAASGNAASGEVVKGNDTRLPSTDFNTAVAANSTVSSNTALLVGGVSQTTGPTTPATGSNALQGTVYIHSQGVSAESVLQTIQFYASSTGVFKFKILSQNTNGTLTFISDFSYTAASTGLKTLTAGTNFSSGIVIPSGGYVGIYAPTTTGGTFTYGGSNISFNSCGEEQIGTAITKSAAVTGAGALQFNYTVLSNSINTKINSADASLLSQLTTTDDNATMQTVGPASLTKGGGSGNIGTNVSYLHTTAFNAGKVAKIVINATATGNLKFKSLQTNPDGTLSFFQEVSVTISSVGLVTLIDGTDFSNFFVPQGGYIAIYTPSSGGASVPYTVAGGVGLYQISGDFTGAFRDKGSILSGFYAHMRITVNTGTVASQLGNLGTSVVALSPKRDIYDSAEGVLSASGLVVTYTGTKLYSRGAVLTTLSGTITAAATVTSTNKRCDVLQINPVTYAVSIVQGTERNAIDATEDAYRARVSSGNLLIGYITVINTTATVIAAGNYEGIFRKQYEAELTRCIRLGQLAVAKTTKKLIRGTTVTIAGYGDSITGVSTGGTIAFTAGGSHRDRVEFLQGWAGDALPTTYDFSDGVGSLHVKIGWNWQLKAFLEKKYGTTVNYSNYGIAGTTSANTTNNGLFSTRIAQIVSDAPDLVVVAFGMNEIGSSSTYANIVSIITQLQAAGSEVIVMGCPRPTNATLSTLRYTNNQLKRAAMDTGSAFVPLNYYFEDNEYFGLETADYCNANRINHPGTREFRIYGELLTMFF